MGCGTIDRADAFDHALGLLPEEDDARLREHLASCDACRADGGRLGALADRLKALGEVTTVPGREPFADRTRAEVRASMGGSRVQSQTSSWRIVHSGQSRRLKRAATRRREGIARGIRTVVAVTGLVVAGAALVAYFFGEFLVDRYGRPVERSLGADFVAWDLRPARGKVADLAARAASEAELRALVPPTDRLLLWEMSSDSPRAGVIVLLEFAASVARKGSAHDGPVLAAAIRAAGEAGPAPSVETAGPTPLAFTPEHCILARKAREAWRSGDAPRARELVLLLTLGGSPVAAYYSAVIAAEENGGAAAEGEVATAAEAVPHAMSEIAWRRLRAGDPVRARAAVAKSPPGALKDAVLALVERRGTRTREPKP